MITIRLNPIAENASHVRDFLRSISSHASEGAVYEILDDGILSEKYGMEESEFVGMNFSKNPSPESRIEITIPNNCLVLGKDWDKYINYNLENNKPIDEKFVIRRMGLISRPDNGVFFGLMIRYPEAKVA